MKSFAQSKRSHAGGLVLIGAFKLLEGFALVAVAIGVLNLLHRDFAVLLLHWVDVLQIDPDNRYIQVLLAKSFSVTPRQLAALSAGTFFYAALHLCEGTGLLLRQRWGEYFTVIITGGFIPLELYELFRRFTSLKLVFLVVNIAILVYVLAILFSERRAGDNATEPEGDRRPVAGSM
jgi:uncharacterized membrane protein (DUF2068 family)